MVEGQKLLDADPEALVKAATAGDLTKVWRILAAYPSTPHTRLRTREAQTPARPCPPHLTPLSARSWSIPRLTVLPLSQIQQIIAAGGNVEVKDEEVCPRLLSIFVWLIFLLIPPSKDVTISSNSRIKRAYGPRV